MSLKEFSKNDVFRNSLITYPRYEFKIFQGTVSSKNYVTGDIQLNDWVVDNNFELTQGKLWFDDENNSSLLAAI